MVIAMPLFSCILLVCSAAMLQAQADAESVLNAATSTQCPDGAIAAITDFEAEMAVSLFENEGAPPKTGKCHQWWQKDGKRRRYHRQLAVSGGKTTHLATDGLGMLLWEEGGKVQDLLGDPALKDDLKTLRDELRRTEELLETFMLSALREEGVTWELASEPRKISRGDPAAEILVDVLTRKKKDAADLVLEIGRLDHRLYGVERTVATVRQSFRFDFHAHTRVGKDETARRVLLPQRVEYIENGSVKLQANARRVSALRLNGGIAASAFSPPK